MMTKEKNSRPRKSAILTVSLLISLSLLLENPHLAFAAKKRNPPGPVGGPGAGPAWRDNPNKIDNPPGPYGGRGTDWERPHRRQGENEPGEDVSEGTESDVTESDIVDGGAEPDTGEEQDYGPREHHRGRKAERKLNQLYKLRDKINQKIARLEQAIQQHGQQTVVN